MRFYPLHRCAAALVLLGLWTVVVANANLTAEPLVSAAAGEYATLTFPMTGSGTYRYEVTPPEGWGVITRDGTVVIDGNAFVSATFRVPDFAPAGERFAAELRLFDDADAGAVATATGYVEVARRAEIDLRGPESPEGRAGEPLVFDILVTNEGNARDTVRLGVRHAHWQVGFDAPEVTLEPGERRVVRVTLRPTTWVNPGYRHLFYITATSASDPEVENSVAVRSRFVGGGTGTAAAIDARPQVTLRVRTGVAAGLEISGENVQPDLSYQIAPSLSGDLSDFIEGSARTDRFAGDLESPLGETPSSLALALEGEGWDASLEAGPRRYQVGGSFEIETWELAGEGSVVPGGVSGASVRADSQDQSLDLQFFARTGFNEGRRTDTVSANYSTALAESVSLDVGTQVNGFSDAGYRLSLGLSQRLTYATDEFDVSQSYSGTPFGGLHTFGVSGGTRRLSPFGVRAASSYSLSPVQSRLVGNATLFSSPAPNLFLDLSGGITSNDGGTLGAGVLWSVSPRLRYTYRPFADLATSFAVRYGHGGIISGAGTAWDRYQAGFDVGYEQLSLLTAGEYEVRYGAGSRGNEVLIEGSAELSYTFGVGAFVFGGYAYEEQRSGVARVRHELDAGWEQAWTTDLTSRLRYSRTFDPIGSADAERIAASLAVGDLITPGLQLRAGYSLTSPTSLLDFETPYRHDLTFALGYDLAVSFDTPRPVVDLFGGRRGGELSGVAFVDEDLDGIRDEGERPVANLTIQLGEARVTTDADGRYRARVPEGSYTLAFPSGLPATMDLIGDATVHITENREHEHPLPLAPVVSVTIDLFDDSNNNRALDAGEVGIPFGGVVLEGPERRVVRTNGAGRAIVSGLVAGAYVVSVSPDHLPRGYRATTEAPRLTLRAGERSQVIALGAARPPRNVVRTFSSGTLAMLPRALQATVPAGAEVDIEVLVQGSPERIVVVHPGGESEFRRDGPRWVARVRIPFATEAGPLRLAIQAEAGEQRVEQPLFVNVTDQPPFTSDGVLAGPGEELEVVIHTLYEAQSADLRMPDGVTLTLTSEDGYRWTGSWKAPDQGGRFVAPLHVDGRELGDVPVTVIPPQSRDAEGASGGVESVDGADGAVSAGGDGPP